ncbi:MAG: hypothetical protein ABI419_02565 [Ginsengibacter sp.]
MNRIKPFFLVVVIGFAACNSSPEIRKTDPLESGRGFIEASLQGDYVEAKKYLLQDSTNIEYFNGLRDFNSKRSKEEREGYKDANIIIDSTQKISDSVTIISYSNTYKMKPSKLKMVRQKNEWLVDFKYTFTGNATNY